MTVKQLHEKLGQLMHADQRIADSEVETDGSEWLMGTDSAVVLQLKDKLLVIITADDLSPYYSDKDRVL